MGGTTAYEDGVSLTSNLDGSSMDVAEAEVFIINDSKVDSSVGNNRYDGIDEIKTRTLCCLIHGG